MIYIIYVTGTITVKWILIRRICSRVKTYSSRSKVHCKLRADVDRRQPTKLLRGVEHTPYLLPGIRDFHVQLLSKYRYIGKLTVKWIIMFRMIRSVQ